MNIYNKKNINILRFSRIGFDLKNYSNMWELLNYLKINYEIYMLLFIKESNIFSNISNAPGSDFERTITVKNYNIMNFCS